MCNNYADLTLTINIGTMLYMNLLGLGQHSGMTTFVERHMESLSSGIFT